MNTEALQSPRRSAKFGFTLIELLVVIAIICILAAILFPVFATAREKGRQTACLSNLKQIGVAIMQYDQDYDEVMPKVWFTNQTTYGTYWPWSVAPFGPNSTIVNYKWMDAVYPYIKNEGVFTCPDAGKYGNGAATWMPQMTYHYLSNAPAGGQASSCYFGSYVINYAYTSDTASDYVHGPMGSVISNANGYLNKIISPAKTVLVTDGNGSILFGPPDGSTSYIENTTNAPGLTFFMENCNTFSNNEDCNGDAAVARHTGFINALYCDGHAKASLADQFMTTKSLPWRQWQPNGNIHVDLAVEDL